MIDNINQLMEEWKKSALHKNEQFVSDGIVNETEWNNNKEGKKILFILKEAYDSTCSGESWSLTEELNKRKIWEMWKRVSEWAYGIYNTDENRIEKYKGLSEEEQKQCISKIAVLNIKKSKGKSSSDYVEILEYAKLDSEYIIKEINIINPDIIICGSTFYAINDITGNQVKYKNSNKGFYKINIGDKERNVVDYYHPSNHYPSLLNYYGLMNIYQQLLLDSADK